jgi:hypothetical protein
LGRVGFVQGQERHRTDRLSSALHSSSFLQGAAAPRAASRSQAQFNLFPPRSQAEHGKAQFFIFPVALPSLAPRRKAQFNISFSAKLRLARRGEAKQSSTFFGPARSREATHRQVRPSKAKFKPFTPR